MIYGHIGAAGRKTSNHFMSSRVSTPMQCNIYMTLSIFGFFFNSPCEGGDVVQIALLIGKYLGDNFFRLSKWV